MVSAAKNSSHLRHRIPALRGKVPKEYPPVSFRSSSYKQLCQQVIRRDRWKCQVCGSSQNLQVHHKQLRSQQGSDRDSNLITLCASCHEGQHGYGENPRA
jgi:5-methylcytosine-specific restriction endonuclease McrA